MDTIKSHRDEKSLSSSSESASDGPSRIKLPNTIYKNTSESKEKLSERNRNLTEINLKLITRIKTLEYELEQSFNLLKTTLELNRNETGRLNLLNDNINNELQVLKEKEDEIWNYKIEIEDELKADDVIDCKWKRCLTCKKCKNRRLRNRKRFVMNALSIFGAFILFCFLMVVFYHFVGGFELVDRWLKKF